MKVIFLKDVARVGQKGTVKDISDGYALNYLIPNGFAEQATPVKIAEIEALQKHAEAERVEYEKKLSKDVQSLEGARFEMAVRATEKGGLFKSVTPQDVVRLIKNERDVALPEDAVQFPNFKEIGVHPITIRASGLEAHVVLTIIAKA